MFQETNFYHSHEAAAGLRLAEPTLRNSRSTGKLAGVPAPAFIKRGRTVLYNGKTLNAWLAQFEEQASTQQAPRGDKLKGVMV